MRMNKEVREVTDNNLNNVANQPADNVTENIAETIADINEGAAVAAPSGV